MKKIRITIVFSMLLLIIGVGIYHYLKIGYEVQTEGLLYTVNKGSKDVTVFDLKKGVQVAQIKIDIEPHEATTLFNGEYIVVTNYGNENQKGNSLTVINVKSNVIEKVITLGESYKPHGIKSIPNSNKVVVVTDLGNDLLIVDVVLGKVLKRIPTQQKLSHMVALHPNHKVAAVSNIASNTVSVIDIEAGVLVKNIVCGNGAEGLDFSVDGKELWVSNHLENTISIIDFETLKITKTLPTKNEPLRLSFNPEGDKCLVVCSRSGSIEVFDRKTKESIKEIIVKGKANIFERLIYHTPWPVGILVHPNDKYAFVANSNANRIEVIDLKTLSVVSKIKTGSIPDGMTLMN